VLSCLQGSEEDSRAKHGLQVHIDPGTYGKLLLLLHTGIFLAILYPSGPALQVSHTAQSICEALKLHVLKNVSKPRSIKCTYYVCALLEFFKCAMKYFFGLA
jgi:hypothetical protein